MNVLDLTYVISPDMPVYPGTEGPTLSPANTYEKDGFRETLLSMYSHTGTHMDAPAHLFADRSTLDVLPAAQFVGKATVIHCTGLGEGGKITMEHLRKNPAAEQADFLLFYTGWGKYWGKPEYFGDYSRHNRLYRQTLNPDGKVLCDELIVENHALMMYSPLLPDSAQ